MYRTLLATCGTLHFLWEHSTRKQGAVHFSPLKSRDNPFNENGPQSNPYVAHYRHSRTRYSCEGPASSISACSPTRAAASRSRSKSTYSQ